MKGGNKQHTLVSVVVITYNQRDLITETLDSIARQSWPAVEIVVADDCSTDDTLAVVRRWGGAHPGVRLTVVASPVNTGISGNLNRGVAASRGEWLKPIAGDDLLVPRAVERYLAFCATNGVEACVSQLEFFGPDHALIELKKEKYGRFYRYYKTKSVAEKELIVLRESMIPMPGFFVSRRLFDLIGGIDGRYPFGEEWPTFLAILERGFDVAMFDDRLVEYRCTGDTLGASGTGLMDARVFRDQVRIYLEIRRPKMLRRGMYCEVLYQDINYRALRLLYRPAHRGFWRVVFNLVRLANPLTYVNFLRRATRR